MIKTLILTPGEKLKSVRKKYKLTQDDVAGGSITRNLISLIESNKASLTPQVATIVAENINKLCESKSIPFTISEMYLLESIEDQVKKEMQKYIDYLSNSNLTLTNEFQSKLYTIEEFLTKYDLSEIKFEVYYLIAKIYSKHSEFSSAYKYYIKAYENSGKLITDNINQFDLLFSLAFCCDMLGKYTECLDYYAIIESYSNFLSEDFYFKLNFNKMIIHKKLNQFDNCLNEIEYIEKHFKLEDHQKFSIMNTKANCYKNKKLYTKAIDIYNQILSENNKNDIENKLIVLCNMIETYIILHDTVNIKSCLNSSALLLDMYASFGKQSYSQQIYNDLALGALEIKDYQTAKKFFLKAIDKCRTYKKTQFVNESFENLIKVYIALDDKDGMNDLKNKLLEFISLDLIPKNSMLVLKFIQYYNYIGDNENVQNILNFVL